MSFISGVWLSLATKSSRWISIADRLAPSIAAVVTDGEAFGSQRKRLSMTTVATILTCFEHINCVKHIKLVLVLPRLSLKL